MLVPQIKVIKITRPCGCSTSVPAIRTRRALDTIQLESHTRKTNQWCAGPTPGKTTVQYWLLPATWISTYCDAARARVITDKLKAQLVELKEQHPNISETFLL